MGVSLCASRRIDDVTPEDVVRGGREFGATGIVLAEIAGTLAADFGAAMSGAADDLRAMGFAQGACVAEEIATSASARLAVLDAAARLA